MQTYSDRVAAKAAEMIDKEVERVLAIVKAGSPEVIPTHAQYRYFAGQLSGLETAKGYIDEALSLAQRELHPSNMKVVA